MYRSLVEQSPTDGDLGLLIADNIAVNNLTLSSGPLHMSKFSVELVSRSGIARYMYLWFFKIEFAKL